MTPVADVELLVLVEGPGGEVVDAALHLTLDACGVKRLPVRRHHLQAAAS